MAKEEKKGRTIDEILAPYKSYKRQSVAGSIKAPRLGELMAMIEQGKADRKELCAVIDNAMNEMKKEARAMSKKMEALLNADYE